MIQNSNLINNLQKKMYVIINTHFDLCPINNITL